jgi:hypothetical protein
MRAVPKRYGVLRTVSEKGTLQKRKEEKGENILRISWQYNQMLSALKSLETNPSKGRKGTADEKKEF